MSFEEKISCVQRIAIIDKDFEILKKDIDLFFLDKNPKPSITKLLALIIKNYISEANCSFVKVSEDTKKFVNDELKITIKIKDENVSPRIKDQIINQLKTQIINQLEIHYTKDKIEEFKKLFKESNTIPDNRVSLTNKLQIQIRNMECGKYYKDDLKTYLRFLIHEYASLPRVKREEIIFKDDIDTINNKIIKESKLLSVKLYDDDNEYTMKTISIIQDSNTQANYIYGLVQKQGYEEKKGFRIYRIKELTPLHKTYTLEKKENKCNSNFSTYDTDYKEYYKIKLTKKGYRMYKDILHLRPSYTSITNENECYILEFRASEREMYNYFFKFGAECKIIEPIELRKHFHDEYRKALEIYTE